MKDSGAIPDPCTLLSRTEVTRLTGRDISQIDEDGLPDGDENRYCQWQQPGGQLAVFLGRTTADDFKIKIADATPVDGVGEDAFALARPPLRALRHGVDRRVQPRRRRRGEPGQGRDDRRGPDHEDLNDGVNARAALG
nr:hypothetical protein GCM10020092_022710 [Actinoplanes digitatis]